MANSPHDPRIRIDLIGNLGAHVRHTLISLGYEQTSVDKIKNDPGALLCCYFGVLRRRLIPSRPRVIYKSDRFACPKKHLKILNTIEHIISTGADLSAYLSKSVFALNNLDTMLNVWGVHHLHLGARVQNKDEYKVFSERTDELLYCFFTDTAAHFIDVFDHSSFASRTVIEIVHQNWPHILDRFRLPDTIRSVHPRLSESQAFRLARSGYNIVTEMLDGTVYVPYGGGVMWSRNNINLSDRMKTDDLLRRLHYIQTSVIGFIAGDKERIVLQNRPMVELRLCVLGNEYCVEDVGSGDVYRVVGHDVVWMRGSGYQTPGGYQVDNGDAGEN